MKKLFSIILFAAFVLGWGAVSAQCTINMSNTTTGFTPDPPTVITQGVAYAQTVQVYVPTTYPYVIAGNTVTVTIDSVHIDYMTALPTGITYVFNPHDGDGGTVNGGSNGAICFSGTTSDTAGTYTVDFHGTAFVTVPVLGADTASLASLATAFHYAFKVQAPQVQSSCDTLFNEVGDTAADYTAAVTADSGYVAGNNIYGDIAKAEGFAGVAGDYVNSAILYFATASINAADSSNTVTIGVWDNTGTSDASNAGAPGNMIDSAHVTLGQIALAVSATDASQQLIGLLVNFNAGVALTGDTFYVGVVLPSTTGDSISLFTNSTPGAKGDGWELNAGATPTWGTYNNDWGFGGNIGNYIVASICNTPASGYPSAAFTASPTAACVNAPVTFTDGSTATPAASAWNWSFGDGGSSSKQNPAHTYTSVGTYSVSEYVANNLGGAFQAFVPATSSITVNASPSATAAAGPTSSASSANGDVIVTATGGTSPYSYAWSSGSSHSDTLSGLNGGTYTVTVTDANSCTVTAAGVVYVTGIINLSNSSTVKIYPNPATDVLNLVWSQSMNVEVSVLDLSGNVISTMITNGDMKTAFDIHSLAAGAYIVRVTDKSNNQQQSMLFSKF
jgi:PKD repeat protein